MESFPLSDVIGIRIPFNFSIFKSDTVTYKANRGTTIDFHHMLDS